MADGYQTSPHNSNHIEPDEKVRPGVKIRPVVRRTLGIWLNCPPLLEKNI